MMFGCFGAPLGSGVRVVGTVVTPALFEVVGVGGERALCRATSASKVGCGFVSRPRTVPIRVRFWVDCTVMKAHTAWNMGVGHSARRTRETVNESTGIVDQAM